MRSGCLLAFLMILSLIVPTTQAGNHYNASSEMMLSDNLFENWLSIETASGQNFSDELIIRGFTSSPAILLNWELYDSQSESSLKDSANNSVNMTTGQHQIFSKVEETRWNWTITIDVAQVVECQCILEILGLGDDGSTSRDVISLFIGKVDESKPPFGALLHPTLHDVVEEVLEFSGVLSDAGGERGMLSMEAMLCLQSDCQLWQSWNTTQALPLAQRYPVAVLSWDEDDTFTATMDIPVNTFPLEDGIWMGCLIATDAAMNEGQPLWFRVSGNLLDPVADINGPEEVPEGEEALIDASSSLDPGWDWEGIQYVWTIHRDGDGIRVPHTWEWNEGPMLRLDTNISGSYTIQLTVVDIGGRMNSTTHRIVVVNNPPEAHLSLDGLEMEDGETIRLPDAESWSFNSSLSTDDELARGGLSRTWYLDGEEIGNTALLDLSRDSLQGVHELRLVLVDDDGSTKEIRINLVVAGSESDPLSNDEAEDGKLWQILILVTALTGIGLWVITTQLNHRQERQASTSLPSWQDDRGRIENLDNLNEQVDDTGDA